MTAEELYALAESLQRDIEQVSEFQHRAWCSGDLVELRDLLKRAARSAEALADHS